MLTVLNRAYIFGRLSDVLTLKLARRNNGVMEAEHRLWLFVIPTICVPAMLILWGVGASTHIHWFGIVFALGFIACVGAGSITLSVNYMIDSYHEVSGDAITTIMLVRNTMSFAVGYGLVCSPLLPYSQKQLQQNGSLM